ncbi:FimD/PapC N-terminal domain-containing protein, partial [Escherichia coli]
MFYMFNRFVIITVCSLFFTKNATAGKYSFDASMLKRGGEGIDMALFEEGGQQPGIYPVNIILNGDYVGSENITFYSKKDKDGKYYLKSCLTQDMLTRYGIKTEEYP